LETLTPEEKAKMDERRQKMEELREQTKDLPEEQRREKFREAFMNDPDARRRMEQRMKERVLYSTPEQRAEENRRMLEWRRMREQRGTR
jgi:hypothetical protein